MTANRLKTADHLLTADRLLTAPPRPDGPAAS